MTTYASPAADLGRIARLPCAGGIRSQPALEGTRSPEKAAIWIGKGFGCGERSEVAYGLDYRRAWFWKAARTIDAAERCLPWQPNYVVEVPEFAR